MVDVDRLKNGLGKLGITAHDIDDEGATIPNGIDGAALENLADYLGVDVANTQITVDKNGIRLSFDGDA